MSTTEHLETGHGFEPRQLHGLDLDYLHDDLHARRPGRTSRPNHTHDAPATEDRSAALSETDE